MIGDERPPSGPVSITRRTVALTPRQREILGLLCEGKVNKEIARELDIGLGTVKQHLVTLFKRLNVRNRSMAVSQGMALLAPHAGQEGPAPALMLEDANWVHEGILVRHPCVVLSLALPAAESIQIRVAFQRTLSGLACDAGILFIPHENGRGDLLFGIRRSSENDLIAALQFIQLLQQQLAQGIGTALAFAGMSAALNAGMAVVSKGRQGSWSGEVVASPVIAASHRLLQETRDGDIHLGAMAREVLRSFGPVNAPLLPPSLPMANVSSLFRIDFDFDLLDQSSVHQVIWKKLAALLCDPTQGSMATIEGETGMGKSHLCRALMGKCQALGGQGKYLRALPITAFALLCDTATGDFVSVEEALAMFSSPKYANPDLLVIDDTHLLPQESQARLLAKAPQAIERGRVLLFSGRRMGKGIGDGIQLRRLTNESVNNLLASIPPSAVLPAAAQSSQRIQDLAAGVPLFAIELARSTAAKPTLALMMIIASRLDGLDLDWKLLQTLAVGPTTMEMTALAELLGESGEEVEQSVMVAIRSGILSKVWGSDNAIGFRHPLVRQVISLLGI